MTEDPLSSKALHARATEAAETGPKTYDVELNFLNPDGREHTLTRRVTARFTVGPDGFRLDCGMVIDPKDISWIGIKVIGEAVG